MRRIPRPTAPIEYTFDVSWLNFVQNGIIKTAIGKLRADLRKHPILF
jgi:uncharacterized membrane protein